MVDVSVVVPARDAGATIRAQLEALARQEGAPAFEVIVADNRSVDDTSAVVDAVRRDGRLDLRLVSAAERPGINHARNVGVRAARGRRILFCDADDVVWPHWVARLHAALDHHDAVGGVVDTHRLNSPATRARLRDPHGASVAPVMEFLPRPLGCNCAIRREAFDLLGGFDEAFDDGGGDETEFFWRLQLAGLRLGTAEAWVSYRLRPQRWAALRQLYRYGRAKPRLYARFREHQPPRSGWGMVRSWWWLVSRSHHVLGPPPRRARWLRTAAKLLGRLTGSVRHRVLYL